MDFNRAKILYDLRRHGYNPIKPSKESLKLGAETWEVKEIGFNYSTSCQDYIFHENSSLDEAIRVIFQSVSLSVKITGTP